MTSEFELQLLREIEELKKKVELLEGKAISQVPTFQYSKIRERELKALFDIEKILDEHRFDAWFASPIQIEQETDAFLQELLEQNKALIESYGEEDLKTHVIAPILNRVRFTSFEKNVRDFYELPMTYATSRFILSGAVDFVVSEGLVESKTPYFFLQEFKRSEEYGNPRPQLLAELISAVELNEWTSIKGAYVIGGNWHFVMLEKLTQDRYQYVVSLNFDSTKLNDLRCIYKHLVAVKREILEMIERKTKAAIAP